MGTTTLDDLQSDCYCHVVDNDIASVEPFTIQSMFANNNMEQLFEFSDVTTQQCFSDHVFDAFECDDLEPVGIPLYLAIKDVGSRAIRNCMRLTGSSSQQKQAIRWLETNELAHNGLLFPETVSAQTSIGSPVVMTASTFDTPFGRRQRLLKSGWECTSGRAAQASARTMNLSQCDLYYQMLQDHLDAVIVYEEAGQFSHSQGVHYYQTVLCAFHACTPVSGCLDSVWRIPLSMTVEVYAAMQNLINGTSTHDPRESLQKKRAQPGVDAPTRRVRARGRGRRGISKGRGQRHSEVIAIVPSDEEINQPEPSSLPTAPIIPASILPVLRMCNDVDTCVAAAGSDINTQSNDIGIEMNTQDDGSVTASGSAATLVSGHNPDIEESNPQRAEQITAALRELEHIARSHHKNTTTADTLLKVLPFLCEAILDGMDLNPVDRVEKAMNKIQECGHKFWGSGDVYSRRRTARDCLLLVYHDAAYRSLTTAVQ